MTIQFTKRLRDILLLIFGLTLFLCPLSATDRFEGSVCNINNQPIVLCFDLRDDNHLRSGLVVTISVPSKKDTRVLLPFHTTDFEPDRTLFSTWGQFDDFTLISFTELSTGMHSLIFNPVFDSNPDSLDEPISRSSLIFVKKGLERRFTYHSRLPSTQGIFPSELQQMEIRDINVIGVVRPPNATGLELRNGKTEQPDPLPESAQTRFYKAIDDKGSPSTVEIRYQLPPTPTMTLVFTYVGKFAAALAAPFIVILFLNAKENIKPRARTVILWILGILQLTIAAVLAYLAWNNWGTSAANAVADCVVVIITAAGSAIPVWLKREPSRPRLTVQP